MCISGFHTRAPQLYRWLQLPPATLRPLFAKTAFLMANPLWCHNSCSNDLNNPNVRIWHWDSKICHRDIQEEKGWACEFCGLEDLLVKNVTSLQPTAFLYLVVYPELCALLHFMTCCSMILWWKSTGLINTLSLHVTTTLPIISSAFTNTKREHTTVESTVNVM